MPEIVLESLIKGPIDEVFDLSRNIDFHQKSLAHTGEKSIGGKTSGLIELGQTVTWRAKHFGITQTLTSKITEFDAPKLFVDEMVSGAFESFRHEHHFKEINGQTLMTDIFIFRSPFGAIGKISDVLFLESYMRYLLKERNSLIQRHFEKKDGR